jgi:hypothetical protein
MRLAAEITDQSDAWSVSGPRASGLFVPKPTREAAYHHSYSV